MFDISKEETAQFWDQVLKFCILKSTMPRQEEMVSNSRASMEAESKSIIPQSYPGRLKLFIFGKIMLKIWI